MDYQIIVLGHGSFPKGYQESLTMLLGSELNIKSCCYFEGESITDLKQRLNMIIDQSINKKFILLCDLQGGSPMQTGVKLMIERSYPFYCLSGVNIPLGIDLVIKLSATKDADINNVINDVLTSGRDGVLEFKGAS